MSKIIAEFGPAVWSTVYRLLNHDADALDCYQETFVAAWEISKREPIVEWPSLLTTLATRRAMDRLRQRYRSRTQSLDSEKLLEPSNETYSPQNEVLAAELMERVRTERK